MKNDLEQYKAHVCWWLHKLSLEQWMSRFSYMEDDVDFNDYEADANVEILYDSFGANFHIKKNGRDLSIAYCARHEALELLVSNSFGYLENFYSTKFCAKLRHEIVHRLEKILPLPSDKEVGYFPKRK